MSTEYPISVDCTILDKLLGRRCKGHLGCIRLNYPDKSARVQQHSLEMDHEVCLDSTTVLYRSVGFWNWNIIESTEVVLEVWALNRDTGFQLNFPWKPAFAFLSN